MADFTMLNTLEMPWESMPGIPGFMRRLLRVDGQSRGTVELQYAPPGFSPEIRQKISSGGLRHYHRTVTERHYFLAGDLPNCDWRDLDDEEGKLTVYRRHTFLDRPPLTLHGLIPGREPATGSEYLVWNTGPGTALWEPEAALETVEVPMSAGPQWSAPFTQPNILQVDILPWEQHPVVPQWKRKVIASCVPRSPQVEVVLVPPGQVPALRAGKVGGGMHWLYLLAGSLEAAVSGADGTRRVGMREGTFLDLARGSELCFPPGAVSEQGCTALCVGHNLAASN